MRTILLLPIVLMLGCEAELPKGTLGPPSAVNPSPPRPVIPYGLKHAGMLTNKNVAGEPGVDGWTRASSEFGGFTVELPDVYVDTAMHMPMRDGSFVVIHTLLAKPSPRSRVSAVLLEPFPGPDVPFDVVKAQTRISKPVEADFKQSERTICGLPCRSVVSEKDGEIEELLNVKTERGEFLILAQYPPREKRAMELVLDRVSATVTHQNAESGERSTR